MYKLVLSSSPFDQRLQFHLSHQVDQASPEKSTEGLIILFVNDKCKLWSDVILCSPHLQPNWAWRSRESPGSFVSLLAEQTLLTSGTRLTICTLKRSQSGDTSVGGTVGLTDTVDDIQNDLSTQYRLNTYSRTRCSNRSLRAGRTRWTL